MNRDFPRLQFDVFPLANQVARAFSVHMEGAVRRGNLLYFADKFFGSRKHFVLGRDSPRFYDRSSRIQRVGFRAEFHQGAICFAEICYMRNQFCEFSRQNDKKPVRETVQRSSVPHFASAENMFYR